MHKKIRLSPFLFWLIFVSLNSTANEIYVHCVASPTGGDVRNLDEIFKIDEHPIDIQFWDKKTFIFRSVDDGPPCNGGDSETRVYCNISNVAYVYSKFSKFGPRDSRRWSWTINRLDGSWSVMSKGQDPDKEDREKNYEVIWEGQCTGAEKPTAPKTKL
jgi:hypothetical protein